MPLVEVELGKILSQDDFNDFKEITNGLWMEKK